MAIRPSVILIIACVGLEACSGRLGANSDTWTQAAAPPPSTPSQRAVQVAWTAASARYCAFGLNPQKLKEALQPRWVAADDRPEYRRVKLKMARRRRMPAHQYWGILDPQKMRAMSA